MLIEVSRNPFKMAKDAALSIKGNARACVFTEPIFYISNTMYTGYMTLYMLSFGISKTQVGMITSLGLASSILFAFISPYVTDKFGRRYTTLFFDTVGWGGALLAWALARDIRYFIVAAVFNAFIRVISNSYYCLMLEDSPAHIRIQIYNFLQVAAICGSFFTPVGALLISKFSFEPAMRMMFSFGVICVLSVNIIRHFNVTETELGRRRLEEMKNSSILSVYASYIPVLKRIISDKTLIAILLLRTLNFIQLTIRNTFLAVLVTERFGFPAGTMAVFHTVNAFVMLFILLFVSPYLSRVTRRWPIGLGLAFHLCATSILLLTPGTRNYPLLIFGAVMIALGTSVTTPRIDALAANTIINEERSVVNAIMSMILLLISTPFGYIGGALSGIDARLPFLLNFTIFMFCLLTLRIVGKLEMRSAGHDAN